MKKIHTTVPVPFARQITREGLSPKMSQKPQQLSGSLRITAAGSLVSLHHNRQKTTSSVLMARPLQVNQSSPPGDLVACHSATHQRETPTWMYASHPGHPLQAGLSADC